MRTERGLAWLYLTGGLIGLTAAAALTLEKIAKLTDPSYVPTCSINPVISCGSVMDSPQAEAFGFPNPLIGIAAFAVGSRPVSGSTRTGPATCSNESTAWNLALGVGLLWAAFRSRVTTGLIPVLAGFVVVLAPYAIHDLATGAVAASRVAEHGLLVLALALLIVINRRYHDPTPREGTTLNGTSDTVHTSTDDTDDLTTGAAGGTGHRPPLRPAGRHHAA